MIPNQTLPQQTQQRQNVNENQDEKNQCVQNIFEKQFQIISDPRGLCLATLGFAVIFLVLAVATAILSYQIQNIQLEYAQGKKCTSTNLQAQKCSMKFTVQNEIPGPIYLLYVVKNIYINHRKFLNSYSLDQIKGKVISADQAQTQCAPIKFNKNIPENQSWSGKILNKDDIASPCGIKPQGYFNDSFSIYKDGQKIIIDRNATQKITSVNTHRAPNSESTQWIDPQNFHFKYYMLDGSLMTKKKLWGVLRSGLKPGNYQLLVDNNYQMTNLRIIKGILLTTSTIIGGKQYFYPICFGIAGIGCVAFAILVKIRFRNYGTLKAHHMKTR